MLIAQSDAGGEAGAADVAAVAKLCRDHGALECIEADDPPRASCCSRRRRAALTALEQLGTTMIDDVCVPRSRLADFIGRIEQLSAELDITDRGARARRRRQHAPDGGLRRRPTRTRPSGRSRRSTG